MDNNLEAQSYSKSSYRMVQRVRQQGAEYGIDVPYLKYPLPTERKTGFALKAMLALSAVLVVAGLSLLLWAIVQLLVPVITTVGSSDWGDSLQSLPILGLLGSLSLIMVWLIVIVVPVLGLAMAVGGLAYLLMLLRICRLSMPEKAVGFYLTSVKKTALLYAIGSTVITVALFILVPTAIVGIIAAVVSVYLWVLFVVLQIERHHALTAFKQLSAEQQADFTAHSQALKLAHSRRQARKASQTTAHRGKLGVILKLFDDFGDARIVYNNLKDNDAMRPTATGLARRAFGQLAEFAVSVLLLLGLIYGLMLVFADVMLLKIILLIFAGVATLYGVFVLMPTALNFAIKQLRLNHHRWGWVALVLTLLALAVAIGLAILVLSAVGL